jgi:hypothetical protein
MADWPVLFERTFATVDRNLPAIGLHAVESRHVTPGGINLTFGHPGNSPGGKDQPIPDDTSSIPNDTPRRSTKDASP